MLLFSLTLQMESISSILQILREQSTQKKISYFLTILFLLLAVDLSTDFFTNFFTSQKIEQIEKIQDILSKDGVDSTRIAFLKRKELQITSSMDYRDLSLNFLNMFGNQVTLDKMSEIQKIWHYISCSILFASLTLLCLVPFFIKNHFELVDLLKILVLMFLFASISCLLPFLLLTLPSTNIFWFDCIVKFLSQCVILAGMYGITKIDDKKPIQAKKPPFNV